jgi:adenylate cyclase
MYRKQNRLYAEWIFVTFYWLLIFYLYYVYVFWGYAPFFKDNILTQYASSGYVYYEILIQATLFSLAFNLINTITDRTNIRRKPLWQIILFKSIFYLAAIIITEMIVVSVFFILGITEKDYFQFMEIATPSLLISFLTYFLFSIIFINFFLQMNRKIGPGIMFKLLIGRYHNPREEIRIFMFLDLVDSTMIAEKLGHKTYSHFLRHCFHDLTDIVLKYKAEIYQYVGDEVVLSWTEKNGLERLNCIKTFFAFENALEKGKDFYLKRFQYIPRFRAGLDMGVVTVAEIGDIKREIAFHGDVLNTAARLQGICKNYDCKMLISDHLGNNLHSLDDYISKQFIGEVKLRGKQERTKVYRIDIEKENI